MKELIQLMKDKRIITNPQFILSDSYRYIDKNEDRLKTLLKDNNWKGLNHERSAPTKCLEVILNYYGIDTKLQRGSSETRRELLAKATEENKKEFKAWKRLEGDSFKEKYKELRCPDFEQGIKNITFPLYLWNGINEGLLTFHNLGNFTKQYIRSFDHLIVEVGTHE